MKILLVNDDGYFFKGITTLACVLSQKHEVTIVAPDGEKSGSSHALNFTSRIKCIEIVSPNMPFKCYKMVNAFPCDCVKFGLIEIDKDFDCVISGINPLCNIGTDCYYSGTVNAASEGAIMGKPSLAVSVDMVGDDYSFIAEFVNENLDTLLGLSVNDAFVNINFPSPVREDIKGLEFTRIGVRKFADYYHNNEEGSHLRGSPEVVDNLPDTDVECIKKGKISVSVLRLAFDKVDVGNKEIVLCW